MYLYVVVLGRPNPGVHTFVHRHAAEKFLQAAKRVGYEVLDSYVKLSAL